MSVNRRSQAERTEATRRALIAAARRLFAERGFADTGTEAIVREADVTRGALYHHFADKMALFEAVYRDVETEVVASVGAAAARYDAPLDRLRAGARAFLDACLAPEVHRITLIDAPAVLGWDEWKRLDAEYGLGVVRAGLQNAMRVGAIAEQPVDAVAHVVLGAITEGALLVARSDDPARTAEEVGATLDRLIGALA